ncbi:MAG TPA: 8-amino-7-oxononanoate synthase [Acidimicrobiales bacterium]
MSWRAWIDARLDEVRAKGQWRSVRDLSSGTPSTRLVAEARDVITFASNDYLGLSQHPRVIAAAVAALERYGTGAGASRLVVGSRPVHHELECALAEWKGTDAAILFPTGYMANVGVLTALAADVETVIVSDERNHASIIDGARLARGRVEIFHHGDLDQLEALLRDAPRALVITDTVFSMDGDVAPVDDLVACCRRHGALLVLDEAHAVLGPTSPAGNDVVLVGTLSKALGSVGGFVAASREVVDLLRNTARSFIFTTAPAPADSAAALAALEVVRSSEGDELRRRLRANVDRVRPGHPSPIVPVIVGDERDAIAASDALLERGLLVPAIRPPTVPPGTSRLRVALSAAHTSSQVDMLVAALRDLGLG